MYQVLPRATEYHEDSAVLDAESWYAVVIRSRQEKVAASMLEHLGVTHFLPLVTEMRKWSDRRHVVVTPLFPGYLFVRIPKLSKIHLHVLRVPGITRFLGDCNGPLAIPNGEIESVRAVLAHRVPYSRHPFLKVGDRVRVVRGPLLGIEGTLTRCSSQFKLILSVEMIQRSVAIDVSVSDVEPAFVPPQVAASLHMEQRNSTSSCTL